MNDEQPLVLSWRQDFIRSQVRWWGGWFLARVANIAMLAVFAIFGFILWKSLLFFTTTGGDATSQVAANTDNSVIHNIIARLHEMFTSPAWHPERAEPEFGILSMLYGSLVVTLGAMVVAIPISLATALVLSDMVPFGIRQWIKPIMELLAAIPSVAFGFFAIKVVAPWLQENFGFPSGTNALNASLILAIMAIPTIVSVAEDALTSLGRELREVSYALGATRMETLLKVVIPAAHGGILTAIVLGTMRAVGETMVVWMAAGNASNFPTPWYDVGTVIGSFGEAVRTMTATLAGDMGETSADSIHRSALFAIGFVLLLFTFVLNMLTEYLASSFKSGMGHVDLGGEHRGTIRRWLAAVSTFFRKAHYLFLAIVFWPFRLLGQGYERVAQRVTKRIGEANHQRLRLAANSGFTGASFLAVAFLGVVLVLVLGSLLGQGREAFLFCETVEHRLFLSQQFDRRNRDKVAGEFTRCMAARKPVYETLDRYAWLAPEPLLEQTGKWDRAARKQNEDRLHKLQYELELMADSPEKAERQERFNEVEEELQQIDRVSRRLVRYFTSMCEAVDADDLLSRCERITETAAEIDLSQTPVQRIVELATEYYESAKDVDLSLRNTPTQVDPNHTFGDAFRELRNRIIGSDGNGALLGPEQREGNEHLPPEVRFGTSHWSMAKKSNRQLQRVVIWQTHFAEDGSVLPNVQAEIDRRELFPGETFVELRTMLDKVDRDLAAMMNPRWTFYWGYFFDPAMPGHFLGGVGAELLGTLLVTLCAIVIALPIGVATAAYLVEAAKDNAMTRAVRLSINTLAGVPSIVFGLFGLAILVQYVTGKPCIMAGSLTLALLVLPVVIRASEEAIRAVPNTFREASLGL
ncbi:MAG: phosphate ABC transporter permease subunit PstC, partial [Planctomycetaceae bacterium]|nr:phosphate ABC transporter permease subunit PstC [Planctomycetaceae bacterium]